MAWQHTGNIGGNGGSPGNNGGDGSNQSGHPHGTEYTLQGMCLGAFAARAVQDILRMMLGLLH